MRKETWNDYEKEIESRGDYGKQLMQEVDFLTSILKVIIDKRLELKLSQRDLAKLCNVPQSTIARIERMNVSPNLDTLFKILQPLGLTIKIVKQS